MRIDLRSPDEIVIRELKVNDLSQVVTVHIKAFPNAALTKLGSESVRRYYEWQLTGPHNCYALGAFDHDTLLGFSFSGTFRGSLYGFLQRNKRFLMTRILTRPWLLFNPLIIDRIKAAFRSLNWEKQKAQPVRLKLPSYGILSTAVDPSLQGHGIGKLLTQQIENYAIEQKFQSIHISVHLDNQKSIQLHEKLGYVKLYTEEGQWQGVMEKDISRNQSENR